MNRRYKKKNKKSRKKVLVFCGALILIGILGFGLRSSRQMTALTEKRKVIQSDIFLKHPECQDPLRSELSDDVRGLQETGKGIYVVKDRATSKLLLAKLEKLSIDEVQILREINRGTRGPRRPEAATEDDAFVLAVVGAIHSNCSDSQVHALIRALLNSMHSLKLGAAEKKRLHNVTLNYLHSMPLDFSDLILRVDVLKKALDEYPLKVNVILAPEAQHLFEELSRHQPLPLPDERLLRTGLGKKFKVEYLEIVEEWQAALDERSPTGQVD